MPALVTTGPSILSSTAFAVAFVWLSLALGKRLLRWLGLAGHESLAESAVVAVGLGAGALQFVPIALGAAGVLDVIHLRLAIGVATLLLIPDLISVARSASQAAAQLHGRRPRWPVVCAIALLPALVVAALLAFTPTIDPDGLGYHLTVPKRWLASESLTYLPTYPYSNTPMGVEMLFAIALAFAGDAAAKSVHLSFGVWGVLAVFLAGKRLRSETIGVLAMVLFLVGPFGVGGLLGSAYLEGATSFAMIASTLAWSIWFQERKPAWLRCAFALAGVGVSFKITAAVFPVALGVLTLAVFAEPSRRQGQPLLRSLLPIWQVVPFVVLPVAPWLVRSALTTGNPVFPLFAGRIPSRDLSPELARQFENYNRYMLWASRIGANWSLERRKLILGLVAIAVVLLAGLCFARWRSYMARSVILVVAGTVLVQLGAVGLYARYWIPSIAVIQLPLLMALPERAAALASRWLRTSIVAATALASLLQARQGLGSVQNDVRGLLFTAVGVESQRSFLVRHLPLFPIYEQANQRLAADAKIMLSTYCGGFYLDRTTYCAEFVQDALRFTDWQTFVSDIRRLGVTQVLAPTKLTTGNGAPPGGGSVSEIYRVQQNEFVGRLLNERGKALAMASDQALYSVELSGAL